MKNKKFFPAVILSLAVLFTSCSAGGTEVSETVSETISETVTTSAEIIETTKATTEATTVTTAETPSVTTAFAAEEKIPINAELCINADGTLNEAFVEWLIDFAMPTEPMWVGIFPALWDFDEDGIPEIIITEHTGGQGRMPSFVYSAETLEEIGEFKGFCRDGFTRFINTEEGTVIYNFYEHSNWQRVETVETVRMEQNKLVSQSEAIRQWSNNEEYGPRLELWKGGSTADENYVLGFINMTAEYYCGNVCTSFDNRTYDTKAASENAVESYNNYIRSRALTKNIDGSILIFGNKNQYAFFQTEEGCFFIDENGGKTLLKEGRAYFDIYTLGVDINDDIIIVCQPFGNVPPCDVYVMTDGKPVLDEKLSGHGMHFDYSHYANCRFELTESVYDASDDGGHTFKKYQFYRDKDGFHEYGSIKVPLDEFNKVYGETAQKCVDKLAKDFKTENMEVYEVLYRGDCCFVLNCREPIELSIETDYPFGYSYYNVILKLNRKGELTEAYRDYGVYKTALIPEIAVYPEEYYTEGKEWDKCIVKEW